VLEAVVIIGEPIGDAGAVTAKVDGLVLTLDVARAGQLVRVVAPVRSDGISVLERLLEEPLPLVTAGERRSMDLEVRAEIRPTLARLALALAGRGGGSAWDVEIRHLYAELRSLLGIDTDDSGPEVAEFIAGYADQSSLISSSAQDSDVSVAEEQDHELIRLGMSRLQRRRAIAAARSGRQVVVPSPDPLLLTEQKARSAVTQWVVDEGELCGNPPGPAGSFEMQIGTLRVEADMVEPTRVVGTDGLGADGSDPDRTAFDLVRRLQSLLVLTRDLEVLDVKAHALARAEMAVELARGTWPGAFAAARRTGELAVEELAAEWRGELGDIGEEGQHLLERLGELVSTDALSLQSMPTFRGGIVSDLSRSEPVDGLAEVDIEAILGEFGGSPIDIRTGQVAISGEARLLLDPDGGGSFVSVRIRPGPVAVIDGRSTARGRARIRLHRDLELLGEGTIDLDPSFGRTLPVAGIPDRIDFERIEVDDLDRAPAVSREALAAELSRRSEAASLWLDAADAWSDVGDADLAAICIERAAVLASPEVGWRLIRRALILGTEWATGRLRPPQTFVPVWRLVDVVA
jgi:hypothetical protein